MPTIRTQQDIYNTDARLDTPQDVERFWQSVVANPRFRGFERNGERGLRTFEETGETVPARVEHGRWLADCVCGAGMACWDANQKTACLGCGRIYLVDFPDFEEARAAEAVLAARPTEQVQHWHRHEGETLTDLKVDNIARGFPLEGKRSLVRDIAEVHGVDEKKAKRLLDEIAVTGDPFLLPEDI